MSTAADKHRWRKQRRIKRRGSAAVFALRELFGKEILASVQPTYPQRNPCAHGIPGSTGKTLASRDTYQTLYGIDARIKQANNGRTAIGNPDEGPSILLQSGGKDGGSTKNFPMSEAPMPKYAQGKPGLNRKRKPGEPNPVCGCS